jgi:AcrR family transcriptional regulator
MNFTAMLDKRQSILEVATRLFAYDGYHAVGIDRIILDAGVAKMTFYKHFPSKKKLIIAVLEQRASTSLASLREFVKDKRTPETKLRAVFDWHAQWFSSEDFTGCMFIAATAEFHSSDAEISRCSAEQKRLLTDFIAHILDDLLGGKNAARMARQCVMLLDGAVTAALVDHRNTAAEEAWLVMRSMLRAESEIARTIRR